MKTAIQPEKKDKSIKAFLDRNSGEAEFNFVIDCSDAALKNYLLITPDDYAGVFTKGDLNWCLQTYLILAKRGNLAVQCSNNITEGKINILHSDQLLKLKGSSREFLVCVRADYPRRAWAHFHLVQNGHQLASDTSYIPHWIQPGLIKRNPERRGVKRVAYSGAPIKGNMAGTAEKWKKLFEPYGIEFVILPNGYWHDLSSVDVLTGIRSFDKKAYHTKPPTKLFSAWHANIPFVGGYDSAFREIADPGTDYLRAGTAQEVVNSVLRLREDPDLYNRLVERGRQKAQLYNELTIARAWEEILSGPVTRRYEKWKQRPEFEKKRFLALQHFGLFEHASKQLVKKVINFA